MRRLLALILATLSLALAVPLVAHAQADPNAGTLVYSGTVTASSGGSQDLTFELACTAGVCEVPGAEPSLIFTDGVAAYTDSGTIDGGDGCVFAITAQRDVRLTPAGVTGTSVYPPYSYTCPDGSGTDPGFTYTYDMTYVSGETCLIDASCAMAGAPGDAPGDSPSGATAGPGRASYTDD